LLSKNVKIKIYKTIILSLVLYGCETWFLALWEEHGKMVFENRALRMCGPNSDEIVGGCKKTRGLIIYTISPNNNRITKSRRIGWTGHVARTG
jgi:hypothetical protein